MVTYSHRIENTFCRNHVLDTSALPSLYQMPRIPSFSGVVSSFHRRVRRSKPYHNDKDKPRCRQRCPAVLRGVANASLYRTGDANMAIGQMPEYCSNNRKIACCWPLACVINWSFDLTQLR
jgi:hypothetical protein